HVLYYSTCSLKYHTIFPQLLRLAHHGLLIVAHNIPHPPLTQHLHQRRGERRLPVIHVTNRTNVHVGLAPLKFRLRHTRLLFKELELVRLDLPALMHTRSGWGDSYCARPASTPSTPARNDQSCVRDARARESARPLRSGSTKRF